MQSIQLHLYPEQLDYTLRNMNKINKGLREITSDPDKGGDHPNVLELRRRILSAVDELVECGFL